MTEEPIISDRTENLSETAIAISGPVLLVNLFTPKPGMEADFIAAQTNEYVRLQGQVEGWIGNRLARAVDGSGLVNVALFDGMANYNAWRASKMFAEHLDIIRPFVATSAPGMYEVLYRAGNL